MYVFFMLSVHINSIELLSYLVALLFFLLNFEGSVKFSIMIVVYNMVFTLLTTCCFLYFSA